MNTQAQASGFIHGYCAECGKHDYIGPLHGERGGPRCCLLCIGKWDAEHAPRRRARRGLIRALKAYDAAGGSLYSEEFNQLKLAASGFFNSDGILEDFRDLTTELLTAALALTHPDKHPPERKAEAQRVTQELIALKPFVFPAPEPEPPPKPGDGCLKETDAVLNKPSPAAYPCDDCRDTVPSHYCDVCRARWEKEQENEHEREEQQRKRKNARQRERYLAYKQSRDWRAKPIICAWCGDAFKPKRSDARYCSAACRQRAYVKRDGKASNAKPLGREEIERAITHVLTSNPNNAFTTDDLCDCVYLGSRQVERKHRATIIPIAKKVCERLGENWDWWRSEMSGGTLVFWNRVSVTSYAMARLKSCSLNGYRREGSSFTEEVLKARIAPGGRDHEYVVEGGAWWEHCQEDIAKFKQATANQNRASADLTKRQQASPCLRAAAMEAQS
jgi:hypothetical protein